jgi:hypothetical protein
MTLVLERASSGPLRWRLVNGDGRMWRRYATRREAVGVLAIFDGDLSRAPAAYRDVLTRARRKFNGRDAVRYAVMWAQDLNLGPGIVRADPDTGEPLPAASEPTPTSGTV